MLQRLRYLLEMIRFSHTLFALPFALLAAVMAWKIPVAGGERVAFRGLHFAGILICMVGARSAAMAFNRLVDRRIDAQNPRTRARHLPAGILSVASVVVFTIGSSLLFIAGTLCFWPNYLPLVLCGPVLAFLLGYSFAKRFTSLVHFWLGAALMLSPICVWIALRGEYLLTDPADILPAVILGGAVLLWVAGFDVIYACQDHAADVEHRLRSLPVRLGISGALRLAAICHLAMMVLLVALPTLAPQLGLGAIFYAGIAAVSALLLYEHLLVKPDDLTRVNVAFFHVNAIVSVGLFVVTSVDLLISR